MSIVTPLGTLPNGEPICHSERLHTINTNACTVMCPNCRQTWEQKDVPWYVITDHSRLCYPCSVYARHSQTKKRTSNEL